MATPGDPVGDIFLPGGRLRLELLTESAVAALQESVRFARETRWDCVRSPHVFMGLLSAPDAGMQNWGQRFDADLPKLLGQFQKIFHQEEGEAEPTLVLNREFLSDNVIRLLREAYQRATGSNRKQLTPMDVLISLLTAPNSIVAECFVRIGLTPAKLTELAVMAEQHARLPVKRPPGE